MAIRRYKASKAIITFDAALAPVKVVFEGAHCADEAKAGDPYRETPRLDVTADVDLVALKVETDKMITKGQLYVTDGSDGESNAGLKDGPYFNDTWPV